MGSDQSWNLRIPSVHAPEIRLHTRRYDLTYPAGRDLRGPVIQEKPPDGVDGPRRVFLQLSAS